MVRIVNIMIRSFKKLITWLFIFRYNLTSLMYHTPMSFFLSTLNLLCILNAAAQPTIFPIFRIHF